MVDSRDFPCSLGEFGSIPAWVAVPSGWVGGFVADVLIRRGWSTTGGRKTLIIGGPIVSTVIILSVFTQNAVIAVVLLSIFYGALTSANASVWLLPMQIAPTAGHVGSLAGLMNFAGIFVSIAVGALLDATGGSFLAPMFMTLGFLLLGIVCYAFVIKKIEPLSLA